MSKIILPGSPEWDYTGPPESEPDLEAELPQLNTVKHDHVQLSWPDRLRLREVAKQALIEAGCPRAEATDREADKYIDSLMRETAEKMIERAVRRAEVR